jgi:copper chaperone CopZ
LHIDGMSCGHCLNAVSRALSSVAGAAVRSVQMGRAEVEVSSNRVTDALVAAVEKAGYRAATVAEGRHARDA